MVDTVSTHIKPGELPTNKRRVDAGQHDPVGEGYGRVKRKHISFSIMNSASHVRKNATLYLHHQVISYYFFPPLLLIILTTLPRPLCAFEGE